MTTPRNEKPEYRDRFPCAACGTGYLDCAGAALVNLKCCTDCDRHPARFSTPNAYSEAEIDDIWARSGTPRPPAAWGDGR